MQIWQTTLLKHGFLKLFRFRGVLIMHIHPNDKSSHGFDKLRGTDQQIRKHLI